MLDKIVVFARARKVFVRYHAIPSHGQRFTKTFYLRFYLGFSIFFSPAVIGNFVYFWRIMFRDEVSLPSMLECIHVNAEMISGALSGFLAIHYGNEILEFYYYLGVHKFSEPDNLAEVYEKQERLTKYIYYFARVAVSARIANSIFRSSYCEAKKNLHDERYLCGMYLPFWFPFEMNILMKIWIYFTSNLLFIIYVPIACLGYFIVYAVSDLIVLRMTKLKQMFKAMDFQGNREIVKRQLVEGIEYHSELWDLVKIMNNSFGMCHAMQYSLVSGVIALIEYELIVSANFTAVFQLLIWICGELLLCSAGQQIENEREATAIALYMTPWYKLPVDLRRIFTIFLAKMQMPLHLEAKPMIHLNYEFLMKVLKGSYSCLMFLLQSSG